MGKKGIAHRVYTAEFKAEAVALVEKKEKPTSRIAKDLGINDNMLRKWVQNAHEAAGTGLRPFPGHGRPRDEELARLRKENKSLREANEILKKAAVIFAQEGPR
jgi:transposase